MLLLYVQIARVLFPDRSQQEREAHLPAKTHLPTEAVNVKAGKSLVAAVAAVQAKQVTVHEQWQSNHRTDA